MSVANPAAVPLASRLSHLAVFAALYIAAAVVCFAQLAGIHLTPGAWAAVLAYSFATAAAVYLLDRVKLAGTLLDPADRMAHPARFTYLAGRQRSVRLLAAALLLVALPAGVAISAWVPALSVAACVGVLAYAGRPRGARARIKDRLLLKNAFVAAGITAFAAVVSLAAATASWRDVLRWPPAEGTPAAWAVGASAALLLIRVWADAALCDLDDEAADRAFGTHTLPTHLGRSRAWTTAMLVRLGLAAAILAVPGAPIVTRAAWAAATAASSLALRLARPRRVRDWVDLRLPVEAAAAGAVIAALGWAG